MVVAKVTSICLTACVMLVAACGGAGGPEEFLVAQARAGELAEGVTRAGLGTTEIPFLKSVNLPCEPTTLRSVLVTSTVGVGHLRSDASGRVVSYLRAEGMDPVVDGYQFGTFISAREGALIVEVSISETGMEVNVDTGCYRSS